MSKRTHKFALDLSVKVEEVIMRCFQSVATMLGYHTPLPLIETNGSTVIDLTGINWRDLPSYDAWVIKLEYLAEEYRDPIRQLIKSGILRPDGRPVAWKHRG